LFNAVDLHYGYIDPQSYDYTNIIRMFANSIDLCLAFAIDQYDDTIVVYTDFAILSTYSVLALFLIGYNLYQFIKPLYSNCYLIGYHIFLI